jgi:hypothetical protein
MSFWRFVAIASTWQLALLCIDLLGVWCQHIKQENSGLIFTQASTSQAIDETNQCVPGQSRTSIYIFHSTETRYLMVGSRIHSYGIALA